MASTDAAANDTGDQPAEAPDTGQQAPPPAKPKVDPKAGRNT